MNDTGLVAGNVQNKATDKQIRNSSKFDLSYNQFFTARFGENNVHFVMECVPKDKINLRSVHELRTFSLKAPLMQDIEIKKDYFAVPMEAILPLNWEKIYTNPTLGDDINASLYGCYLSDFYGRVNVLLNSLYTGVQDTSLTDVQRVELILRWLSVASLFYSRGSLMHQLGYHLSIDVKGKSFDNLVDSCLTIFTLVSGQTYEFTELGQQPTDIVADSDYTGAYGTMTLRMFFDYIMHNSDWHITGGTAAKLSAVISGVSVLLDSLSTTYGPGINYSRACAYQIVNAHYYSNDSVDYIYSAELYRQYIFSLADVWLKFYSGNDWYNRLSFSLNGITHYPDYLSSTIVDYVLYVIGGATISGILSDNACAAFQFIASMFGFQNSLRYLDYFTGSKTRPLAVGNVDVNTSGASVSVVDITRNIQLQKFLNSVNRTGRKFSSYIKGLFGDDIAPDYHNPFYLGHTSDKAVAVEVENTGAAQVSAPQSVTSIAKSNASQYAFEFVADRPCILIGITYFDIARNYISAFDKQLFHVDRYDMFNPYLQFVGDQAVRSAEYNGVSTATFGYQLRYAEYKQRVNSIVGGFVEYLPGYAFDASEKAFFSHWSAPIQNPDFIRSHPWELDKLYLSLTGSSLASYFHFIVKCYNSVEAVRPMAFAPSIL